MKGLNIINYRLGVFEINDSIDCFFGIQAPFSYKQKREKIHYLEILVH